MLICVSCNVEYEEDKKYCNYCGGPLSPKAETASTQKKVNRPDEEKSDGKLVCPNCKITYEFGSSCIQCGSPLGRQIPSQAKEEPETIHGTESEEKPPPVETSEEQKTEAPPKKLICPTCKIIYEHGDSCIKCESALVPQPSTPPNEEPKISSGSEVEEKSLQVQTIQEQLTQTPRTKLICPECKIIYERGSSCVRCGSALVSQTASQEREKSPLPEGAEVNLLHLQPEGRGHAFGPSSGRKIEVDLERPSPSGPKGQDQGVTERGKRKELRVTPTPEIDATEEPSQARTPEQPSTKKSADDFDKRGTFLKKPKKDYRRLFLEAGSITIMVLAGGYLLWSVYAHFIRKPPGPGAPVSKDPAGQILPSSSSSAGPVTSTTGPGESKNTVGSSSNPQGAIPSPLSLPDTSKTPSVETQEIGNIKILLENIRRANLQEDIDLFVSCYASDFGNLDGKKKATQAYWKNFNYLELSYDLKDPSISADTARARVEWLIKTSSKTGGRLEQNKSILDVTLKKEEGGWKIKEVKPVR